MRFRFVIQILFLSTVISAAFWLGSIALDNKLVQEIVFRFGYLGVFLSAFVSGFNLLVPVPVVAFLPLFLVSGLQFWLTIITVIAGMTAADMAAYAVGRIGGAVAPLKREKVILRLEKFHARHPSLPFVALFLFASFAPLPNEILVVPFGFMGYRFFPVLLPVLFGNSVFAILYSVGVLRIFESLFM